MRAEGGLWRVCVRVVYFRDVSAVRGVECVWNKWACAQCTVTWECKG